MRIIPFLVRIDQESAKPSIRGKVKPMSWCGLNRTHHNVCKWSAIASKNFEVNSNAAGYCLCILNTHTYKISKVDKCIPAKHSLKTVRISETSHLVM